MRSWPLGVFTSVDAGLGVRLDVLAELGVPTIQLHAPRAASRSATAAADLARRLNDLNIQPTCVFAGFEGESYADIPTVAATVGLVPRATREARTAELLRIAEFARQLGVSAVGIHIGLLPHDEKSADYAELVALARRLCGQLAPSSQAIHLETGQEPVEVLRRFLQDVDRENLLVNFDPANMILYGSGQPLPALAALGAYVRGVHCKDATWSDRPGDAWGTEVPVGQGDVDFPQMLGILADVGYAGPLTIEREIPQQPEQQLVEIGQATDYLRKVMAGIQ